MQSKELVFIMAQPDDTYFRWQIEVQINNARKLGLSDKYRYLMFLPHDRMEKGWNKETRELPIRYPEVSFYWYEDTDNILDNYVGPYQYIPLLRPYILAKHFKENPDLVEKAIYYQDADVIWTKYPDFLDKLKDDDICYLSDTKSYIAASYWDSKINDVRPDMLEKYKEIDSLDMMAKQIGITREVCVLNEDGSGGAQYLLKGIDHAFWLDVFRGCLNIRAGLSYHVPGSINSLYFESENKGFQSWCADMWSVLWNLWKRGKKTICPPEMEFAWATDPVEKWKEVYVFHNAGATGSPHMVDGVPHILFYKAGRDGAQYANNVTTPFEDMGHSLVSPQYCSAKYCEEVEDTRKKREFSILVNN